MNKFMYLLRGLRRPITGDRVGSKASIGFALLGGLLSWLFISFLPLILLLGLTVQDQTVSIEGLPKRWTAHEYHQTQHELFNTTYRFCCVPSGRRSGKTELAKRRIVICAVGAHRFPDELYVCAAPTRDQAKRIFWGDLKLLTPRNAIKPNGIRESELTIHLKNGATIGVVGMDKPERIEGPPLDGIVLDEYANMRPDAWTKHIRPALSTRGRPGWAWLIGVPEGRNHYYEICKAAHGKKNWKVYKWKSSEIIDPEEIEEAKGDMDLRSFLQEYEGEFISHEGLAYYEFDTEVHAAGTLTFDPSAGPLVLCLDFNRVPGVMLICQEQKAPNWLENAPSFGGVTCVIGEVFILKNSNTKKVCRAFLSRWGAMLKEHPEIDIHLYGDSTGKGRNSSSTEGSDWDLVRAVLKPFFKERLKIRYDDSNPEQRVRVNRSNSRIRTADGVNHVAVDFKQCPEFIKDMEGCETDEEGNLIKEKGSLRTHLSDGFGYYVNRKHPRMYNIEDGKRVKVSTF